MSIKSHISGASCRVVGRGWCPPGGRCGYLIKVTPLSSEIKLSLFLTVLRSPRSHFSWSEASSSLNFTSIISSARVFKATYSASRTKPQVHPPHTLERLLTFGRMKDLVTLVGRKTLIVHCIWLHLDLQWNNQVWEGFRYRAMSKPGILKEKVWQTLMWFL